MTKRNFLITILTSLFLILSSIPVLGVGDSSEPPRILRIDDGYNQVYTPTFFPGSWKYFLKTRRDRLIDFILILDPVERSYFELKLANKRLLEAQELCEKQSCEKIEPLIDEYQEWMRKILMSMSKIEGNNKKGDRFITSFFYCLPQQKQVLARIEFLLPEKESQGGERINSAFAESAKMADAYWELSQLRKFHQDTVKR